MAVELPARRPKDTAVATSISINAPVSLTARRFTRAADGIAWPRLTVRVLEILPGALALMLISTLVWGYLFFPKTLAVGLLVFDVYWLWKSWTIGYHVMKGVRMLKHQQGRNWRVEHAALVARGEPVLPWDGIRHVVVIPNYKETEQKLRDTLSQMAKTDGAREKVIPVLAMEEAEPGAAGKADLLTAEFRDSFYKFIVTFHPYGLIGEVRGKSSNQAWAANEAYDELVERGGLDLDHLTITSCDADTLFPPQYFDALAYFFATEPQRYRRFWQAPIFFYNNIWQVPAPLRVPNALSGLIHLSRLTRSRKVLFSQSTYSLSMRMAHEVGYWDTDIIPEDWHMFLKCYYQLGGEVDVEPIHLPVGNDGALSHGVRATYVNQYLQVQRWAWGASDIPYAFQEASRHPEIPWHKRYLRLWYFFENHLMWSTQWFFITLGGLIPSVYGYFKTGEDSLTPQWFSLEQAFDLTFLPGWLAARVTIPALILTPCLIPYAILLISDWRMRPKAPTGFGRMSQLFSHLCWLLISPITFLFSALPALDSQMRLMLGKRMEYRVTEKV
ncbi:MAG TPA: glycosyltransferase family 2 protein [Dehalococcoidia bacterium]|nr:glycosyltransferase family 2 protein [Dehalococcoidia bacterium]